MDKHKELEDAALGGSKLLCDSCDSLVLCGTAWLHGYVQELTCQQHLCFPVKVQVKNGK